MAGEALKRADRKHGVRITADTVACFRDGETVSLEIELAMPALGWLRMLHRRGFWYHMHRLLKAGR